MVASISRIWTLWWSTRPGRNSMRRTRLIVGSASAVTPSASGTRRRTMAVVSAISGSMQEQGPDDGGDVSSGDAGEWTDDRHQQRDRRVDQPRPVHLRSERRVVAVLDDVLPALAVEQIGGRDHPHRVVAVAEEGHGAELQQRARREEPCDQGPRADDELPVDAPRFGHAVKRIAQLAPRQALYALLAGPELETDIKISLYPLRQPRQISTRWWA